MGWMHLPDEPTTPEQWQVIAWGVIAVLLGLGVVGLYLSFRAPPEKIELAHQLRLYSFVSGGLAGGVYAFKRGIEWLVG